MVLLFKNTLIYSLLILLFFSCHKETPIPVVSDFTIEIRDNNHTVPVIIDIKNKTTGADLYLWTFQGGNPENSTKKNPSEISYNTAGTYTIRLESWNNNHRDTQELSITLDSAAILDFSPEILVNSYVPAEVKIINSTQGAASYEWIFEGGAPDQCTEQTPPVISYSLPGVYEIKLKVITGRKSYELTKNIHLLPELEPGFNIVPDSKSLDMQVPWKGYLVNNPISGTSYRWKVPGGYLDNDTATSTQVYFDTPGTYSLVLEASNGKQTKAASHEIRLLENTNLFTFENLRFGTSANKSLGCFFSGKNGGVISEQDLKEENEPIDIVFFGLNQQFNYCLFVSPDRASEFSFPIIPDATKTWISNTPEESGIQFSDQDFDAMLNDLPLRVLNIRDKDSGNRYFNSLKTPRVVLFETADGRKGAIKIKRFVSMDTSSYIETDIKIQKEKMVKAGGRK